VASGSFTFPDEAKLARALLQSANIPNYLENEHTLAANWMWTNALGGLRLLVPARFLEDAREVLGSSISESDLSAQAEAAPESESAPDQSDDKTML
jgi:Putative prokaryotic signal transducing protein